MTVLFYMWIALLYTCVSNAAFHKQHDVIRAQCQANCLQKHGSVVESLSGEESSLYDVYLPSVRCPLTRYNCNQCLIPCARILDNVDLCKQNGDTTACRSSCEFVYRNMLYIEETGLAPTSVSDVSIGKVSECCQEVLHVPGQAATDELRGKMTLYIRWNVKRITGLWQDTNIPLTFILRVRAIAHNGMTTWKSFQSMDAWLPITVNSSAFYQFEVTPVLADGLAGPPRLSPWIQTHSDQTQLGTPSNATIHQIIKDGSLWIAVDWKPSSGSGCYYKAWLTLGGNDNPFLLEQKVPILPEFKILLGPLLYDRQYVVYIAACSRQYQCNGKPLTVSFKTKTCLDVANNDYAICEPNVPTDIRVSKLLEVLEGAQDNASCSVTVSVNWKVPTSAENLSTEYIVSWYEEYNVPDQDDVISNPDGFVKVNGTSCIIEGLTKNTEYHLEVISVSSMGSSRPLSLKVNTSIETGNCHVPQPHHEETENKRLDYSTEAPGKSVLWYYIVPPSVFGILVISFTLFMLIRYTARFKLCYFSDALPAKSKHNLSNPLYFTMAQTSVSKSSHCEKYEITYKNITVLEKLGEGVFGVVNKAELIGLSHIRGQKKGQLPQFFAVKTVKDISKQEDSMSLQKEIGLMKSLGQHPNIVSLVACVTSGSRPALVMDYCPHGDLLSYLRKWRELHVLTLTFLPKKDSFSVFNGGSPSLSRVMNDYDEDLPHQETTCKLLGSAEPIDVDASEKRLLSFARQIAFGMEYLAGRKFVHRDLAARNVLVFGKHQIKIGDFGLSRDVYEGSVYLKSGAGKLPIKWMSIEAIFDQVYTSQSDVWSFGIVLWEIFTLGGAPYPGIDSQDVFKLLKEGYRMEQPEDCPDSVYSVMTECWRAAAVHRPAFSVIKERFDDMLTSSDTECAYMSFNS